VWVQLRCVVIQLLGPAHVSSTEFKPRDGSGHTYTRWFLAWTWQPHPNIRHMAAKVRERCFQFTVTLLEEHRQNPAREIASRVQEYCRTLPGWELICVIVDGSDQQCLNGCRLEIRESHPKAVPTDDKAFPEKLQALLKQLDPTRRMELLPLEGHFAIDITVTPSVTAVETAVVEVVVEAYNHSSYGKRAIEKITCQLQGEICRTNRRWRRKIKRQQQEQEQQTATDMDES